MMRIRLKTAHSKGLWLFSQSANRLAAVFVSVRRRTNQYNSAMPAKPNDRNPLSISQLNRQAKQLLESQFASVWVVGELSNFARPSSGHWYFSLKDDRAQVRCAMFRSANARLRFQPEAGQQVQVRAKLSLYEARGDYQLIVEHMEPAGAGALAAAFEALKAQLQQEGLFDPALKRPVPTMPRHIAVVTSPTGAAIHDILTVLARRFPLLPVTLIPVPVQGDGAAQAIAAAIDLANDLVRSGSYDFDVLLVGRGGGSLEDLWAFNEEVVARAIAASDLPVVSAVGHETDVSIADFSADVRAATPSAAAELLSPDQRELMETLAGYEVLLQRQMQAILRHAQQQLNWLRSRLRHPGSLLRDQFQRLDELELRLLNAWRQQQRIRSQQVALSLANINRHNPRATIANLQRTIAAQGQRLQRACLHGLERHRERLRAASHLLDTVSPLATLSRGYSITRDQTQRIIRSSEQVQVGAVIETRLAQGTLRSRVENNED